jgi:large subunit ribosomal protein L18
MDKKQSRLRRARQTRLKIAQLRVNRLSVHRTNSHIYASIIDPSGSTILVAASTAEPDIKKALSGNGSNIEAAAMVGKRVAEKAKAAGITSVAFDRSGFKYHGRVKALAEAAREGGLQF